MTKQKKANLKSKKTYITPKFIKYGAVRELTQAGSTGVSEGSSGHLNKAPKP